MSERYVAQKTIYQDLMDEIGFKLTARQGHKALSIFEVFIQYIAKNNWRYCGEGDELSLLELAQQPSSFQPKVSCLVLAQTLCDLLHTYGVDAKIHVYYPYGSSLSMKVPGKFYPGILPSYKCFDPEVNKEMIRSGEVKFSRHWVVVVDDDALYLDPTFCCYYREKEAILAPETSDR